MIVAFVSQFAVRVVKWLGLPGLIIVFGLAYYEGVPFLRDIPLIPQWIERSLIGRVGLEYQRGRDEEQERWQVEIARLEQEQRQRDNATAQQRAQIQSLNAINNRLADQNRVLLEFDDDGLTAAEDIIGDQAARILYLENQLKIAATEGDENASSHIKAQERVQSSVKRVPYAVGLSRGVVRRSKQYTAATENNRIED